MNKTMLPKLKGRLVRLRPQPRELAGESRGEPPRDIVFRVQEASEGGLYVYDRDSTAGFWLAPDHIREYLTGGKPEPGGDNVGFLRLKVQWYFRGEDSWVEPIFGQSGLDT